MDKKAKLSASRTIGHSQRKDERAVEKAAKIAIATYKEALKELEKH